MNQNLFCGLRSHQKVYRRRERFCYYAFKVLLLLVCLMAIVNSVFYLDNKIISMYLLGWLNVVFLGLLLLHGLWLIYLMRRYHHFEYIKARSQIIMQLVLFSLIVFTNIFICFIGVDIENLMYGSIQTTGQASMNA